MKFFRGKVFLSLALMFALALAINGCAGEDGPQTTSVDVVVSGPDAPTNALFQGTFDQVLSVRIDVIDGVTQIGSITTNNSAGGSWTINFDELPVGPQLMFDGHAFNAIDGGGTEIFAGSTLQILSGSGDLVEITMNVVEDVTEIDIPRVNLITLPGSIVNGTTVNVTIDLQGSAAENLDASLASVGADPGTFSPTSATVLMSGAGIASWVPAYTAPQTSGTYDHTVKVVNSQGNSVAQDFPTNVVASATTVNTITFSPVVTALAGQRTGNDVSWMATVSDDNAAGMTFAWSFAKSAGPAASFSGAGGVADANPGVMVGYDQTVEGVVTLTATDTDGGSTTITFTLNAGQFPDNVISNP